MAAILKSKMVVSGNNIVRLYIFMTICIWQFPCNFFYIIYLSSFFLKVAKNACKYHKLQSPAKSFPQIRFMGIFNMLFVIPFCINWHKKALILIFSGFNPSPTSLIVAVHRRVTVADGPNATTGYHPPVALAKAPMPPQPGLEIHFFWW